MISTSHFKAYLTGIMNSSAALQTAVLKNQHCHLFFQTYKVLVKKSGSWLSRDQLFQVLAAISNESTARPVNPIENCVSLLTSDARPSWAQARGFLMKGEPSFSPHLNLYELRFFELSCAF